VTTTAFRVAFCGLVVAICAGSDWPGFRGPDGRGASDETGLPTSFSESENLAWKVPLVGTGPSSPIVVGGRVIVTAASGPRQDLLHVMAFDAESGELVWHRQLWATGSSLCNSFGGVAANTPAGDDRSIFAFFSSGDLACFDVEGNLRWLRGLGSDYPDARNDVGMAASPCVVGQTVIVQMECLGDSFAAGLDTATGTTRWHIPREKGSAWCSPTVLRGGMPGGDAVLLQSRSSLTANDPLTGRQLWSFDTQCHTIATVTGEAGIAYLPANGLTALRPQSGGVELLWHEPILRSGNSSPIVWKGRAYTIKSPGILVCGDAGDGRVLWQLRLKGPFWASAAVAGEHLVAVSQDGLVQVVRLGDSGGEVVGSSQLGDSPILASPAVADGAVYFRSNQFLWKFASSRIRVGETRWP
jgi:outer membrane protein assembly factor BamB